MSQRSTLLLEHHLKELRLPSFLREYGKLAAQCAAENADHPEYLLRLAELELIDRHQRMVERRIRAARFPAVKSLDTFDFPAIPSVNKALVMELARCEYIQRRENVIAVGNSGTGKTHVALGLGLAACQRGMSVGFTTAAGLVHELMEARDERRLMNLQRQLSRLNLLIIDELGFVPLSPTGAELLFEVFSQRYERGSILVTTNLPFDEWTEVFGSERLTGALLDRLTHHVHILEMNGESYRLKRSRENAASQAPDDSEEKQGTPYTPSLPAPATSPPWVVGLSGQGAARLVRPGYRRQTPPSAVGQRVVAPGEQRLRSSLFDHENFLDPAALSLITRTQEVSGYHHALFQHPVGVGTVLDQRQHIRVAQPYAVKVGEHGVVLRHSQPLKRSLAPFLQVGDPGPGAHCIVNLVHRFGCSPADEACQVRAVVLDDPGLAAVPAILVLGPVAVKHDIGARLDHEVLGVDTQSNGRVAVQGVGEKDSAWITDPSAQHRDLRVVGVHQLLPLLASTP